MKLLSLYFFFLIVLSQGCVSISKMRYTKGINIDLEWLKGNIGDDTLIRLKQAARIKIKPVSNETEPVAICINKINDIENKYLSIDNFIETKNSETQIFNCNINNIHQLLPSKTIETVSIPNGPVYANAYEPAANTEFYRSVSSYTLAAVILGIAISILIFIAINMAIYTLVIPSLIFPYILLALAVSGHRKVVRGLAGGRFFVFLSYLLTLLVSLLSMVLALDAFLDWFLN